MAGNDSYGDANTLNPDPRTDIKEPLEKVLSPIINDLDTDDYIRYAILILLFNHIDLLGQLLTGDPSKANRAKRTVKFIRTYLGKVDEKYAMAGGFIYYMLGNGLVHKSFPGVFDTGNGMMLRFEFSNIQEKQHLSVTQSDNEFRLIFSISKFYQDLLTAIDVYCVDLNNSRSLQEKYYRASSQFMEPEDRSQINNHAYILASDLGFISDQIS